MKLSLRGGRSRISDRLPCGWKFLWLSGGDVMVDGDLISLIVRISHRMKVLALDAELLREEVK